jgi:hypothetical protein
MLMESMWKRFIAFLFLLALVGQAWASVCDCFASGSMRMKCCDKKRESSESRITKPSCCNSVCGIPLNDGSPRSSADAGVRIQLSDDLAQIRFDHDPVRSSVYRVAPRLSRVVRASQYARPPNLYIQFHSFLI